MNNSGSILIHYKICKYFLIFSEIFCFCIFINMLCYNNYSIDLEGDDKILRSSTIYIKDMGRLVGLLCLTFDDSKFKDISDAIMSLCHPDELIKGFSFERIDDLSINQDTEIVSTNVEELISETINSIIKKAILIQINLRNEKESL